MSVPLDLNEVVSDESPFHFFSSCGLVCSHVLGERLF
jgi:hypothetical protein